MTFQKSNTQNKKNERSKYHYWKWRVCRVSKIHGEATKHVGEHFAKYYTRQTTLSNNLAGKYSFVECQISGTSANPFPSISYWHSAIKSRTTRSPLRYDGTDNVVLPSMRHGTRQSSYDQDKTRVHANCHRITSLPSVILGIDFVSGPPTICHVS